MKKITTWRPDTCGCELHYEWDDAVPAEQRVHTPVSEVKTHEGHIIPMSKCRHHQAHITPDALFAAVVGENQYKNKVIGHILENIPEVVDASLDEQGNIVKQFKAGMSPIVSFDDDRILTVKIPNGSVDKKSTIADSVLKKFANAKII